MQLSSDVLPAPLGPMDGSNLSRQNVKTNIAEDKRASETQEDVFDR